MPRAVFIFRHAATEGPGYFADFLDRHHIAHRLIRVDAGDPVPTHLDGARGLVFMGGPMSVNDDLPWIAPVLALIRQAVSADLPVLGHCLGGQLMSKALGGTVGPNGVREIGWLPVQQVPGAAAARWLAGLAPEFDVFHWHGETFTLPAGAALLLKSRDCAHQAYALGKHLALQCHVEMTAPMVHEWATTAPSDIAQTSATVQGHETMTHELDRRIAGLHQIADVLYTHWVRGLPPA